MKKYEVTEKHPALKKGCIISESSSKVYSRNQDEFNTFNILFKKGNKTIFIDHLIDTPIKEQIEEGWIQEIQELEFTKDDMINFGFECSKKWQKKGTQSIKKELNNFIANKL